jgi:hypothetical protein
MLPIIIPFSTTTPDAQKMTTAALHTKWIGQNLMAARVTLSVLLMTAGDKGRLSHGFIVFPGRLPKM